MVNEPEMVSEVEEAKKKDEPLRSPFGGFIPNKTHVFKSKKLNAVIVMESGERATRDDRGSKGKRIQFLDGIYRTKNKEEIHFLLHMAKNQRGKFNKIALIGTEED